MQKLNIVLAILCVLTLQQVAAYHTHPPPKNYSRYMINGTLRETSYTQEFDLTIGTEIKSFTLSSKDSHIYVNPSDQHLNTCIVAFETLSHAFQVAPFNEKFVLWDRRTGENSDDVTGTTLLLIDPFDCNVTNIDVPVDLINGNQPPYQPQVITYEDLNYFDIYYGGRNACLPCRFSGDGKNLTMEFQLPNMTSPNMTTQRVTITYVADDSNVTKIVTTTNVTLYDASPYLIRPLNKTDPEFGYFYARSFNNGSLRTEMNLLNVNFSRIRRKYVDHVIDEVAIDDSHIVVCYKKEHQKYAHFVLHNGTRVWRMIPKTEVYCDVYNKHLNLQNHIKVPVPSDHYVHGTSLRIDGGGRLCVAVPHASYAKKDSNYALKFCRYNSLDRSDTEMHGSLGTHFENFDRKDGYKLKIKASRKLRFLCP